MALSVSLFVCVSAILSCAHNVEKSYMFNDLDICNRMRHLRMLYFVTLTYFWKVKLLKCVNTSETVTTTAKTALNNYYRFLFASEWHHCESCTARPWPTSSTKNEILRSWKARSSAKREVTYSSWYFICILIFLKCKWSLSCSCRSGVTCTAPAAELLLLLHCYSVLRICRVCFNSKRTKY